MTRSRRPPVRCALFRQIEAEQRGANDENSFGLLIAAALALAGVTGCTTKNYVKTQTAPIIDHTNQLEDQTAANNRAIHDVDERATAGI